MSCQRMKWRIRNKRRRNRPRRRELSCANRPSLRAPPLRPSSNGSKTKSDVRLRSLKDKGLPFWRLSDRHRPRRSSKFLNGGRSRKRSPRVSSSNPWASSSPCLTQKCLHRIASAPSASRTLSPASQWLHYPATLATSSTLGVSWSGRAPRRTAPSAKRASTRRALKPSGKSSGRFYHHNPDGAKERFERISVY